MGRSTCPELRWYRLAGPDAKWKALITKSHVLLDCGVQALSIADVEIGEIILRRVSRINAKRYGRGKR